MNDLKYDITFLSTSNMSTYTTTPVVWGFTSVWRFSGLIKFSKHVVLPSDRWKRVIELCHCLKSVAYVIRSVACKKCCMCYAIVLYACKKCCMYYLLDFFQLSLKHNKLKLSLIIFLQSIGKVLQKTFVLKPLFTKVVEIKLGLHHICFLDCFPTFFLIIAAACHFTSKRAYLVMFLWEFRKKFPWGLFLDKTLPWFRFDTQTWTQVLGLAIGKMFVRDQSYWSLFCCSDKGPGYQVQWMTVVPGLSSRFVISGSRVSVNTYHKAPGFWSH